MRKRFRLFRKEEGGQALVELAVVLPLVLFLLFGTIDLASAINAKLIVNSAAREGGRIAAEKQNPTEGTIKNKVEEVITGSKLQTGSNYFNKNSDVTITKSTQDVTVTVIYHYHSLLPSFLGIEEIPLRGHAVFSLEKT